jgi:hypothetical protein
MAKVKTTAWKLDLNKIPKDHNQRMFKFGYNQALRDLEDFTNEQIDFYLEQKKIKLFKTFGERIFMLSVYKQKLNDMKNYQTIRKDTDYSYKDTCKCGHHEKGHICVIYDYTGKKPKLISEHGCITEDCKCLGFKLIKRDKR